LKILNLDELTTTSRKVRLRGKEYDVVELSVGAFIDTMKKANEIEARANKGETIRPDESMSQMIDTLSLALPDCPREELGRLSFNALAVLLKFVNGDDAPVVEGQVGGKPDSETQTDDGGSEKKS
jgi:hypothetical protein